jgi:hypothetical protein
MESDRPNSAPTGGRGKKRNESVRDRRRPRYREGDSPTAVGNSMAARLGVGEAGVVGGEAERLRVVFSSTLSHQGSGGIPRSTGLSGGHGGVHDGGELELGREGRRGLV